MKRLAQLLLFAALLVPLSAKAQMPVQVVQGGHTLTVNANGSLNITCVSGCVSGGTGNVNIVAIGGNAVTTTLPVSWSGQSVAVTQTTSPWVVSLSSTTITGTVAVTQSGTWTVQPGNTANTTAWLVTGTGGTFPVTGTFWQATQPVSLTSTTITGTVAVTQSTSPWVISFTAPQHVILDTTPVAVTGTFFQATQPVSIAATVAVTGPLTDTQLRATPVPVSGTITAACSTACEVSPTTAANTVSNPFFNQISNGSTNVTQDSTTTAATHGLDVNIRSILNTAPTTAGFLDIKGADGNVFVRQATGSNLHTVLDSGTLTGITNHVTVDQGTSGSAWPVSLTSTTITGTVGVTQSTSPWVSSITTWGGGTLGAMANYGTSPGAVLVPGVNAYITNSPAVTVTSGSISATQGTIPWVNTVTGNAASGAADSGNPVKIGCAYNSTPTPLLLQPGQRGDCQIDQFGRILTIDPQIPSMQYLLQALLAAQNNSRLRGSFGEQIRSVNGALAVLTPPAPDPCANKKANLAISQAADTTLITGVPGQRIFVCYARVVAATAEIVNFTEGTGTTCQTGTLAVAGSATDANGESYAANGGFSGGGGAGTIMSTAIPGNNLCLTESATARVSGNIAFVFAP